MTPTARLAAVERARLTVSAASGLVRAGDRLYVVADDDLDLHVYDLQGTPTDRIPLFAGSLPSDPTARKAAKPDLEALVQLPRGELLAIGSGSTPQRCRGALVDLAARSVREVDLSPLFEVLARELPDLNLEGAAVHGDTLSLFQRGNGAAGANAVIELDLPGTLAALPRRIGPDLIRRIVPVDLGDLGGVRLGFTDASARSDGHIVFAAAAEATDDPYLDGPCAGSVVGVLDEALRVAWVATLEGAWKVEGIEADGREVVMVADADDPATPAPLLWARWPAGARARMVT